MQMLAEKKVSKVKTGRPKEMKVDGIMSQTGRSFVSSWSIGLKMDPKRGKKT